MLPGHHDARRLFPAHLLRALAQPFHRSLDRLGELRERVLQGIRLDGGLDRDRSELRDDGRLGDVGGGDGRGSGLPSCRIGCSLRIVASRMSLNTSSRCRLSRSARDLVDALAGLPIAHVPIPPSKPLKNPGRECSTGRRSARPAEEVRSGRRISTMPARAWSDVRAGRSIRSGGRAPAHDPRMKPACTLRGCGTSPPCAGTTRNSWRGRPS